jgi:alcohol dehydrogenase class IV
MAGTLRLNFPGVSFVGVGAAKVLGEQARRLGRRALVVTGRSALREAGITERLLGLLDAAGVGAVLFENVPPEPDVASVDAGRRLLREEGCDLVVEAGGGSAMDSGKAVAALAGEEAPTAEFHAGRAIERAGLPHIAVATTSGTGAEVTPNSVLTDPETQLKQSLRGEGLMPAVSITDPELTLSCPPDVTAASGMDALVQAVESFFSVNAQPVTEALSLRAVGLIVRHLPVAFEHGRDLAARDAMAQGSYMAGLALGSARLGAVHGLAHPVGLCYGLAHGVVCAVLMPAVLERNLPAAPQKYDELRAAMGGEPLQVFCGLLDELDLPHALGPYPDAGWERRIVEYAVGSGSSKANLAKVDEGYVLGVLREVCLPAGG